MGVASRRHLMPNRYGRISPPADVEQVGVLPHVLVARSDQESPSGRKLQIRQHGWAPLGEVRNVEPHEEAGVLGELFPGPDEPSGRAVFWQMAQAVNWLKSSAHIAGYAHLQIRRHQEWFHAHPTADVAHNGQR